MDNYESVNLFDAPVVLASMLVDREFTARGGMNALLNPARLSPAERDTIATRLKKEAGNNGLAGAVIDTALNPWVWLFFATSVPGQTALADGARNLFSVNKAYLSSVSAQTSILKAMGGWTGWQMFRGRAIPDALLQVEREISTKVQQGAQYERPLWEWLQSQGLSSLDPSAAKTEAQKALVEEVNVLLHTSLTGRDRERTVQQILGHRTKDGTLEILTEPVVQGRWGTVDVERRLADLGLTQARDSIREFYKTRFNDLFGDDERMLRVLRGIRNPIVQGTGNSMVAGDMTLVRNLMGPEVWKALRAGEISLPNLRDAIRKAVGTNEFFLPSNVFERSIATPGLSARERVAAYRMGSTAPVGGAADPILLLHPEDLNKARQYLGDSETLLSEIKASQTAMEDSISAGVGRRFLKMDPIEATRRYNNDTAVTYGWHVAAPDEVVRAVMKQEYESVRPNLHFSDARVAGTYDRGSAPLTSHIDEVAEADRPGGGFSLADVIHSGWATDQDPYNRKALIDILIPAISGKHKVEHTVLGLLANNSQRWIASLAETGVGKAIEGSGPMGKRFVDSLRRIASPEALDATAGRGFSDKLARYLYLTHLGFSVPSMILNMTQPFALATTWLGARHVLPAYGDAAKDLFGYIQARAKMGFNISAADRAKLAAEHFPGYADLAGIGPHILEQLDSRLFVQGGGFHDANSLFDKFTRMAMGGFQYSEWFNRSVTYHALRRAYQTAGRGVEVGTPIFASQARQLIAETQFASHPLNTPMAALGGESPFGRLLANPLVRQFLTYPYRTAVGYLSVGPKLGGRTGYWKPLANDLGRMMATSAVIYEMGKNILGVDLTRSTPFAAVTDLLPGVSGGRYDQRESPIPVPPVIDIPFQVTKALATEDRDLLARNAVRLLPAGLAVSRALGVLPPLPPPAGALQRTYADWGARLPNGGIPVFANDGRLISAEDPASLILRGIGADLGQYRNEQDLNNYLLQNRNEMQSYKQEYIRRILNSDPVGANGVAEEFGKRFKMPLRVSKAQMRSATQQRSVPRATRMVDRLPADARPYYAQLVAAQGAPPPTSSPEQGDHQETQRAFDPLRPYTGYSMGSSG